MKRWITFIVTLVLAVSLPLEGLAAIVMPVCSMSSMHAVMAPNAVNMAEFMTQPQTCDHNCQDCCTPKDSHESTKNLSQKCYVCHLGMLQMPVMAMALVSPTVTAPYPALLNEHYQTFTPALFRPPKSLSA